MAAPDISVIMPAYNAAPWLGQAVESVLLQEGPAWELLIIDDGSTDGTAGMARRYARLDPRIHVLRNTGQKGPGGGRNTGLHAARGSAALFLDSDDALWPEALSALHMTLRQSGNPVVLGEKSAFCEQRWLAVAPVADRPRRLFAPLAVSFCQHLFRTDFLAERGIAFPEDLIISEDSLFLAHVYAHLHDPPERTAARVFLYRVNHKPRSPSPAKAAAFLRRFPPVLETFRRRGREEWIIPYLERYFLPEWLQHLHTVRESGPADVPAYLDACLELLASLPRGPDGALRRRLGTAADAIRPLSGSNDAKTTLDILEQHGLLTAPSRFLGINPDPPRPGWYRFSRRLGNLMHSGETRRTLAYLARLRWRSRRRLRPNHPGGCPC